MEKSIDLQTFDDDLLRARAKGSISESKGQDFDRDRYELARAGKEQVLKVCVFLATMESPELIDPASLRTREHDRSFVRFNVYLGEPAGVSFLVRSECSAKIHTAYSRLASRSKCEALSPQIRATD